MIRVGRVELFVRACVASAFLKDAEKPVSFLLIAEPECGKTSVLKRFVVVIGKDCAIHFSSFDTAYALQRDILQKIGEGKIRYIFTADLQNLSGMSTKTKSQLLTFLIGLIEEGVKSIGSYAVGRIELDFAKCGWGGTVQPSYIFVKDLKGTNTMRKWIKTGFASRILFFSYGYSSEQVKLIFENQRKPSIDFVDAPRTPDQLYSVSIPTRFDAPLEKMAICIGLIRGDHGIRAHRDFRQLFKALALIRALDGHLPTDNIEANDADFATLVDLFHYLNFEENYIDDAELHNDLDKLKGVDLNPRFVEWLNSGRRFGNVTSVRGISEILLYWAEWQTKLSNEEKREREQVEKDRKIVDATERLF